MNDVVDEHLDTGRPDAAAEEGDSEEISEHFAALAALTAAPVEG